MQDRRFHQEVPDCHEGCKPMATRNIFSEAVFASCNTISNPYVRYDIGVFCIQQKSASLH